MGACLRVSTRLTRTKPMARTRATAQVANSTRQSTGVDTAASYRVALAWIGHHWLLQSISAVHVAITFLVIVATGNHYVLDAVAGFVLAVLCVAVVGRPEPGTTRVPPADAFFLHVETPSAPHVVGGVVHGIYNCRHRRDVAARFFGQVGENLPERLFAATRPADGFPHVAGAAVVGRQGQFPVAVGVVQAAQVAQGGIR